LEGRCEPLAVIAVPPFAEAVAHGKT